jgi:hypothetical protein
MKNYKTIIVLISLLFILFSCTNTRKIKIMGYAYKSEKIYISENTNNLYNIIPNGNLDGNKLCSFYESDIKISSQNIKLNFKIDSSGITVLDSSLMIPKKYRNPFVTFVYPSKKSKFKRIILLADESMYVKY